MGTVDAAIIRPDSPNLDTFSSERHDLTGDWIMKASLGGLPLSLWITFYDRNPDGVSGLDGAVRLTRDEVDSPPRTTFFTTADADGQFEIWLSDLYLEIDPLVVEQPSSRRFHNPPTGVALAARIAALRNRPGGRHLLCRSRVWYRRANLL